MQILILHLLMVESLLDKDISKLLEQLDNIAEQTNYNGTLLQKQMVREDASNLQVKV